MVKKTIESGTAAEKVPSEINFWSGETPNIKPCVLNLKLSYKIMS